MVRLGFSKEDHLSSNGVSHVAVWRKGIAGRGKGLGGVLGVCKYQVGQCVWNKVSGEENGRG